MQFFENPNKVPVTRLVTGLAVAGAVVAAIALSGHSHGSSARSEITWLTQLAESGNSGAQLQLGLAYRDGRYGLTPDPHTGVHWLTLAGRNGDAYAADAVGNAYAAGQGVPRDQQQAMHWWQLAANGGNADAQGHLGEALLDSNQRDQAMAWLRDAADRGDPRARNDLATLYREQGLPDADLHRGENRLAALGERLDAPGVNALFATWRTLKAGSPVVQSTGALVGRAQQGDPVAEYQLALRYGNGAWSVTRDPQQAMVWLQRSAEAGNRIAAATLAETRHGHTTDPTATSPPLPAGASRT